MIVKDVIHRARRGTTAEWFASDRVLMSGEPGYNLDTGELKFGNGVSLWTELDDHPTSTQVREAIAEALTGQGSGGVSDALLLAHINDLTPHPIYDDGPSLLLLYQNAKAG